MTDIASLNIKIDTSDAKTAKNDLDKMTSAGKIAESQMGSMSNAALKLGKALAAAFVSYKIAQFTQDVVMAAARYETLGVVMLLLYYHLYKYVFCCPHVLSSLLLSLHYLVLLVYIPCSLSTLS